MIIQQRNYSVFPIIEFPKKNVVNDFADPFFCCDELKLVLAHPTDSTSWKNDITSAWVKLSEITDLVEFKITKNGENISYTPTPVLFPNEPNAWYSTIKWQDVLNSDGAGCYKLEVLYTISGVTDSIVWGNYELKEYSQETAKYTARLRVKFNLNQEIEGIDFTNSNVEDTIRFKGFIGLRQPNMEIDNLIYQDRVLKSVVRENLNTYEIKTDPYTSTIIDQLTDLYLLSENELYISDYNIFNNSHSILDLPVIVNESPEIDYLENFQRKAVLTCKVGDKTNNKRTHY